MLWTKDFVLRVLASDRELTGLQIAKEIRGHPGVPWYVRWFIGGRVYPVCRALEHEGILEVRVARAVDPAIDRARGGRPRHYYRRPRGSW